MSSMEALWNKLSYNILMPMNGQSQLAVRFYFLKGAK